MLIINKVSTVTATPVVATNDANAVTGNQSALWGGVNPNFLTAATGNAAAGNGLTNVTTNVSYVSQVVSKLVQITITGVLTAASANFIRVPFVQMGITGNKAVVAVQVMGVYDPNATENNNTPTPSWIDMSGTAIQSTIVKDAIVMIIPNNNTQGLFQNKILNVLVLYHNA